MSIVTPPWLADPHYGSFRNDRRLTDDEVKTIAAWADAGAPEGNPKDLPAMPRFESSEISRPASAPETTGPRTAAR